jgi:prolipoprotein diacylglyceryltransferase
MTRVYYKEAVGAFVVFDITRQTTFDAVKKWKSDGTISLLFLMGYSLIRLFTEPIKMEIWKIGVYPAASLISVVIILLSLISVSLIYFPKIANSLPLRTD